MKSLFVILPILALLLILLAVNTHSRMTSALPPSEKTTSAQVQLMLVSGADLIGVLGTGSMVPYIPAGNPNKIVAWVQIERVDFSELESGDLVVYREIGLNILHQIVDKNKNGWSASGLGNERYDRFLVTKENFSGRVAKTYILED
jgi:hypothetical protein